MAWTEADIGDLTGRVAVVTGATSGLGTVTARALAGAGARVLLTARDPAKGAATTDDIRATWPEADVDVVALDLSSLDSVATFADEVADRHDRIDLLVNNAGVMATPFGRTADGFELQIGTNHLGHVAVTGTLLPLLAAAEAARVVTVSSQAHRFGSIAVDDLNWERRRYFRWPAYGQSKLANLLFTFELERRLVASGSPVKALAAHPGFARTHLGRSNGGLAARAQSGLLALSAPFSQPAERGADPQLRAATDPELAGGSYLGPGGPGEQRGPAVIVGSSAAARDERMAAELWDLSLELTGVTFPGLGDRPQ